jgi:hypothetical protein
MQTASGIIDLKITIRCFFVHLYISDHYKENFTNNTIIVLICVTVYTLHKYNHVYIYL